MSGVRQEREFIAPERKRTRPGSVQDFARRALDYALGAHIAVSVNDLPRASAEADKALLAIERLSRALESVQTPPQRKDAGRQHP